MSYLGYTIRRTSRQSWYLSVVDGYDKEVGRFNELEAAELFARVLNKATEAQRKRQPLEAAVDDFLMRRAKVVRKPAPGAQRNVKPLEAAVDDFLMRRPGRAPE